MKQFIKNLKNIPEDLNLNGKYKKYDLAEGNEYLYLNSGVEHYQLLAHISNSFNDKLFFDIGTFRGSSALSLGYNSKNRVISYDIENKKNCEINEPNIEFKLGNCIDDDLLLNSDLILLDTAHDGVFESHFLKHLKDKKYSGVVIMDDVNIFPVLLDLAKQLQERGVVELVDLTNIGHFSGTLALLF
jgi:hypothetical protein